MTNRRAKILVDILLLIFIILSFVRWEGTSGFIFHATVGVGFTVLIMAHLWLNRNWIYATFVAVREKRASKKLMQLFIVNLCLVVTWDIAIISGLLAIPSFIYDIESFYVFGRIHAVSSRLGIIFVIVHIFQHLGHIRSYLGIKKKPKQVKKSEPQEA